MKRFFKAIGNFFKKIGLFIWKYLKVAWTYIKENAWIQPIAIVALIFGLVFGFNGIVKGIEKIKENNALKEEEAKDAFTKLTMKQVRDKMNNPDEDDFVLFIGSHDCVYCQSFKKVLNKYINSSKRTDIYYIDIGDTTDTSLEQRYLNEWVENLANIETRDFGTSLSTPTVVLVQNGQFVDAKSGAQGLSGGMEYLNFVKFVEGEWIGKFEPTNA